METWRRRNPHEALDDYLHSLNDQGGTEIAKAIKQAMNDIGHLGLDSADLMIHTDGEDEDLRTTIRRDLDDRLIRLHAQLYAQDNKALRQIAHTWSLSPSWQWISQVVDNSGLKK